MYTSLRVFWLALIFLIPTSIIAQENKSLKIVDPLLSRSFEISSLAFKDGYFYFAAEKMRLLFKASLNRDSLRVKDSISLPFLPVESEIEGIAFSGNNLFMADERTVAIYRYNISDSSSQLMKPFPPLDNGFRTKMEGIAIKDSTLFLLKEQCDLEDSNKTPNKLLSEIYVFRIGNSDTLKRLLVIQIALPLIKSGSFRCSDLYYDKSSDSLFILRTLKGKEGIKYNQYWIDRVTIPPGSILYTVNEINSDNTTSFIVANALPETVCDTGICSNSNMEGLVVLDGAFYLIADNCQQGREKVKKLIHCCTLPLFVEIKRKELSKR